MTHRKEGTKSGTGLKENRKEKCHMGGRRWGVLIVLSGVVLSIAGTGWAADPGRLYSERCAVCHGTGGEGTRTGPPLKGNPFVTQGDPEAIKKVLREGRGRPDKKYPQIPIEMPRGLVLPQDLDGLVRFLKGELQS